MSILLNEIKDYVNLVSFYPINNEEEELIKNTIEKIEEKNCDYFLIEKDSEVKKYRFNDYTEKELNVFLQTIKVPNRYIELVNFSTKVAQGLLKISDIEIPYNLQIIKLCKQENLTISTCESATSGLLCSTLTNVEGSSNVVEGGYITYTNSQKLRIGVSQLIIDKCGVYSFKCSESMAMAAINNTDTNIGIGVTGTLGNLDINNKDSEIGKIYVSIILIDEVHSFDIILDEKQLKLSREQQKEFIVDYILEKLLEIIKNYI